MTDPDLTDPDFVGGPFVIRDWTNKLCFDGKQFDTFYDGWGFIYETDPEPEEDSPEWLDGWYDDYFVVPVGESCTGRKMDSE